MPDYEDILKENNPEEELKNSNRIASPFQISPRTLTGQTFSDMWLSSWMKSTNYKPRKTGLKIDGRKGYIECKSIYTEDLNVGNKTVYVDVGGDVQQAIDNVYSNGGGTVIPVNGTHKPGKNITVRDHVYIRGQSSDSCIFDFENGAYGFVVQGTLYSTAGTITIATGGVLVNGVGTNFTSSMTGQYIFLGGIWYPISAVNSTLQIQIGLPFGGVSIAGGTYIVADPIDDVRIENLVIKNSTTAGIDARYSNEFFSDDVRIETSAKGFYVRDSSNLRIEENDNIYCTVGMWLENTHFSEIKGSGSIDSLSDSIYFKSCKSCFMQSSYFLNSADAGVKIEDCQDMAIIGVNSIESAGYGWELLGATDTIMMLACGARNGASDGFNISGNVDKCKIIGSSSSNNGGWAVNIVDATCAYNQIALNTFDTNTSGGLSDSGTSTQNNNNITI